VRATALRTASAVQESRARLLAGRDRLMALPVAVVLGTAIGLQWIFVVGLAVVVRHHGWIYYQGGDQLWYYTGGWALTHGQLVQPLVGYLWSALLAPVAAVAGPNLANAYPAIIVFDVVILLPAALLALYGTARLIAGRAFAYGTLVVWLALPLVGIRFADAGYHQRFTELILPQAYGLTAMADFPTMVAAIVSAYFCARVLFLTRPDLLDAAAAGIAAGAAIAIKPSTALFLAGPLLAFACTRLFRPAAVFVVALLPAVLTLALWKYRGYGYLPVVHSSAGVRLAAGSALVALHVPQYAHFDWGHFTAQLDQLREHFWSGRLIEWFVVAGLIALGRCSLRALALVGGWFAAFVIVKGGYSQAGIEDSSLLRILIPTFPAFAIMVASLPYLIPGARRRHDAPVRTERLSRRVRIGAIALGLLVTALAPLAAIGAATPLRSTPSAVVIQQPLIPAGVDLGLRARRSGARVRLRWTPQKPSGGSVFFHVFRSPAAAPFSCSTVTPAEQCTFSGAHDLGTTRKTVFVDTPGPGAWQYRVGVAANWLNDPTQGDVYVLSAPTTAGR
jgi:hypothetical protein